MNTHINSISLSDGQPFNIVVLDGKEESKYAFAHRHEYFEIIWCLDDVGRQAIDFKEYENKKNRFFTISVGQVHESIADGSEYRLITFVSDFLGSGPRHQLLVDKLFDHQGMSFSYRDTADDAVDFLEPLFELMVKENEKTKPNWDFIESLLIAFLHCIVDSGIPNNQLGFTQELRANRLSALIDKHYKTQKSCDFYAAALALTNKRLNEISKAQLGKTVTGLIHDRILLEAKRNLAFSSQSVKTIALDLGFDDPSYLGRFYLKQTGLTPLAFTEMVFK